MGPGDAIMTGLRKSFTASGRASRPEFWWFWAFHFIVPVIFSILIAPMIAGASIRAAEIVAGAGLLLYLATIPGVFTGLIRRQHDIGRSGKASAILYAAILMIALIAFIYLLNQTVFAITGEFLAEAGVQENPAVILAIGPIALMFGFLELILFAMFLAVVLFSVGVPLAIALLTLGVGLARPSDPNDNQYGPKTGEVSP